MDKLSTNPGVRVRWTDQLEKILIGWADKAIIYKWFHTRAAKKYKKLNMGFTIPCVLLSSILASASFSISGDGGLIPDQYKDLAQYSIGGVNIVIGALQTLQNFFKFAQNCEAHDSVAMQWSKFYRMISTELNIERNKRKDADDLLKYCRLEFDRLIELSPGIPGEIIREFKMKFESIKDLELPDICDVIEHTTSYKFDDKDEANDDDIAGIITRLNKNIQVTNYLASTNISDDYGLPKNSPIGRAATIELTPDSYGSRVSADFIPLPKLPVPVQGNLVNNTNTINTPDVRINIE